MKLLYIGDNSDSLNWGCRATSLALRQLVGRHGRVIGTVGTSLIARHWPVSDRIGDEAYARLAAVLNRGKVRRLPVAGGVIGRGMDALGVRDGIGEDIDANVRVLERARSYSPALRAMFDQIDACDVAVVNGEGDLIFSTPARQRLLFTLTVCRLVVERGKKLFYLNAMASAAPDSALNMLTIGIARDVLGSATALSLRDPASFAFARQHLAGAPGRLSLHADAVFSWAPLFARATGHYEVSALLPYYERTGHAVPAVLERPYILVGGSSRSAYEPERATRAYVGLVEGLKKFGMPIALAPGCVGDLFLKDVARETGTTMIPLDAPIMANAAVLANARAYVSGRWHPSIMASLGGTPSVFMGSNSHKTLAIQQMLEYPRPHEYSPWPADDDVIRMVDEVDGALAAGSTRRCEIAAIAGKLGREAESVADLIEGRAEDQREARSAA